MMTEALNILSLALQAALIWIVVQQLWAPFRFPLWRWAWGWLLAGLVLQAERLIYEFYWLPVDLRHHLVALATTGCMILSLWALRAMLQIDRLVPILSPVAHIRIDPFSVILEWDATAERLFGWAAAEAIGQTLMQTIIAPRNWEAHRDGIARARHAAHPTGTIVIRNYATNALDKRGETLPVELTAFIEIASDGTQTFSAEVRRLGRL